jgi:hypothetical protein
MTSTTLAIAAVVCISVLSAGCHSCKSTMTLTFKVIDADTHEPLQGVGTTRHSYNRMLRVLPIGQEGKNETVPLATTQNDGLVTAARLCENQSHGFDFEKSGYSSACTALTRTSTMGTVVLLHSPVPDGPGPHSATPLSPAGVIVVPLYRKE